MNPSDFRRTKENPGLMIYPADMLSSRRHQMMNAEERGVLESIRKECWVNGSVPTDHTQLAKILLLEIDEVRRGLTERVLYYLDEKNGEFTMPDVERYRAEQEKLRSQRSQAGKKGMANRYAQHKDEDEDDLVPHQEIIKLFQDTLPELPQVRGWTEARKKLLKARWEEDEKRQSIEWWRRFFEYIARSDFLCGRTTDWKADLPWILKAENFLKIIEGKYENGTT